MDPFEPIVRALARYAYSPRDEAHLYEGINHVLDAAGISYERERRVVMQWDKTGRLDYFLPESGIAIEVKVQGAHAAIVAQLRRYAWCEEVKGVLLVTTRGALARVPSMLEGKPARAMRLAGGFG